MIPTVQGKPNLLSDRRFLLTKIPSDAFAGGFTAGVVQGKSLEECVHMGQWLARLGIQELGPS
jgi:pfkB family carbohydrate kinase